MVAELGVENPPLIGCMLPNNYDFRLSVYFYTVLPATLHSHLNNPPPCHVLDPYRTVQRCKDVSHTGGATQTLHDIPSDGIQFLVLHTPRVARAMRATAPHRAPVPGHRVCPGCWAGRLPPHRALPRRVLRPCL